MNAAQRTPRGAGRPVPGSSRPVLPGRSWPLGATFDGTLFPLAATACALGACIFASVRLVDHREAP